MNAGQICLAPDYNALEQSEEFAKASNEAVSEMFADLKYNEDYTSVINERHYERINELVSDAKKGAEVIQINPADEDFEQQELHKIPPTLVLNPTDEMKIMQEEIFGRYYLSKNMKTLMKLLITLTQRQTFRSLPFSKDKNKEESSR